jgi:threonyl-tRNA synthetase
MFLSRCRSRCGQILHVIPTPLRFGSASTHNTHAHPISIHSPQKSRLAFNMSHQRNISLRPHDLWGTLKDGTVTQNGTSGTDSSTPKSPSSKRPVSPTQAKKAPKQSKDMSSQAVPSRPKPEGLPDFILERNALFDQLKKEYDQELASKDKPPIKIKLVGETGEQSEFDGKAWETTPGHLLRHVPKDRAGQIVVAKVDDKLWDLDRPFEGDAKLSYVTFADSEGRDVFWHSSAHVLGECAEHEYGCQLSHGPPTATGFFYDMALSEGQAAREADFPSIENRAKKYAKDKQPFERLVVSKDNLKKLFGYSKYKMHYIDKLVQGDSTTVYRNGTLVDLCQGPHIQNTRKIESFKIMKSSSAYFLGDQSNDSLQRIHGVAFPTKQGLKDWENFLEEAKKRDHQLVGREQKLFMFSKMSPGSPFLLPHGTRIFNALQAMLREQYWDRGYDEVQSPNMYDAELWKISGHWQHYQDDMFRVIIKEDAADPMPLTDHKQDGKPIAQIDNKDKGVFALKPMNCPGHCLMFRNEERSYRDLPWRVADFGVIHRNEASGALSGLTRVRKFQQDDTHIFCRPEDVKTEIHALFDFMTYVYGLFGFPFKLNLSTRPDDYMGSLAEWDKAEAQLKEALNEFVGEGKWVLNEGDGAFYGPKIDVTISDALQREFQCATIQLDFQGPQNFKLEYRTSEQVAATDDAPASKEEVKDSTAERTLPGPGMARPVMIHRAIVGSFERFIAVLTEHFAGKWPFWLSPRQILVIPVMKGAEEYVREIQSVFHKARMYVDIDVSGNTLQKKIRTGQVEKYNFIFGEL